MATVPPPSNPTDDESNYTQPIVITPTTNFTSQYTSTNLEEARAKAASAATSQAEQAFGGKTTTQFNSFNEEKIKATGSSPPYNYTVTYTAKAQQVVPTEVSGLTPAEQQAFLLANEGPQGAAELAAIQAQTANEQPQPVGPQEDPFEAARLEKQQKLDQEANNILTDPPPVAVPGESQTERNKILEADGIKTIDPQEDPFEAARLAKLEKLNQEANNNISENPNAGNPNTYTIFGNRMVIPDYRVRLSLAPTAKYLYNDPDIQANEEALLYPLISTNGVLFPYTPAINVTYQANYEGTDLTHSNYKIYNYRNSSVENVSITADFTAQDVFEATYVLAVIHFFRSVTKMFYGKDQDPAKGIPPPLVYLTGHGAYGFDRHPAVVNSFTLNYPTDVDYIDARPFVNGIGVNYAPPTMGRNSSSMRLKRAQLSPGGTAPTPVFKPNAKQTPVTKVPTKMQMTIGLYPIVTRYNMSNNFSLKEYATGKLLQGSRTSLGGGMW